MNPTSLLLFFIGIMILPGDIPIDIHSTVMWRFVFGTLFIHMAGQTHDN